MNLLTTRPQPETTRRDETLPLESPTATAGPKVEELESPGARTRCPWCHEVCFSTGEVTVCRRCYAPHHTSCHRESGCCAGCGTTEGLAPARAGTTHTALRLACGLMATVPTFLGGLALLGFGLGAHSLAVKGGQAAGYAYSGLPGVLHQLSFIVTWGLAPGLLFGAIAVLLWTIFARGPAVLDALTPAGLRRMVGAVFALCLVGLAGSVAALSIAEGDDGLPQLIAWGVYLVLTLPALGLTLARQSPAEDLRTRRRLRAGKSGNPNKPGKGKR